MQNILHILFLCLAYVTSIKADSPISACIDGVRKEIKTLVSNANNGVDYAHGGFDDDDDLASVRRACRDQVLKAQNQLELAITTWQRGGTDVAKHCVPVNTTFPRRERVFDWADGMTCKNDPFTGGCDKARVELLENVTWTHTHNVTGCYKGHGKLYDLKEPGCYTIHNDTRVEDYSTYCNVTTSPQCKDEDGNSVPDYSTYCKVNSTKGDISYEYGLSSEECSDINGTLSFSETPIHPDLQRIQLNKEIIALDALIDQLDDKIDTVTGNGGEQKVLGGLEQEKTDAESALNVAESALNSLPYGTGKTFLEWQCNSAPGLIWDASVTNTSTMQYGVSEEECVAHKRHTTDANWTLTPEHPKDILPILRQQRDDLFSRKLSLEAKKEQEEITGTALDSTEKALLDAETKYESKIIEITDFEEKSSQFNYDASRFKCDVVPGLIWESSETLCKVKMEAVKAAAMRRVSDAKDDAARAAAQMAVDEFATKKEDGKIGWTSTLLGDCEQRDGTVTVSISETDCLESRPPLCKNTNSIDDLNGWYVYMSKSHAFTVSVYAHSAFDVINDAYQTQTLTKQAMLHGRCNWCNLDYEYTTDTGVYYHRPDWMPYPSAVDGQPTPWSVITSPDWMPPLPEPPSARRRLFNLEDYATTYRAARDAFLKAYDELVLSTGPYLSARGAYGTAVQVYVGSLFKGNLLDHFGDPIDMSAFYDPFKRQEELSLARRALEQEQQANMTAAAAANAQARIDRAYQRGVHSVDVDAAFDRGAASVTPEDGIRQSDVDSAYARGVRSVTLEDGINSTTVALAYGDGYRDGHSDGFSDGAASVTAEDGIHQADVDAAVAQERDAAAAAAVTAAAAAADAQTAAVKDAFAAGVASVTPDVQTPLRKLGASSHNIPAYIWVIVGVGAVAVIAVIVVAATQYKGHKKQFRK